MKFKLSDSVCDVEHPTYQRPQYTRGNINAMNKNINEVPQFYITLD